VVYYATKHLRQFQPDRFPVWIWEGAKGPTEENGLQPPHPHNFYGFPIYGEVATKAGQHNAGDVVTTSSRNFISNARCEKALLEFLKDYIPDFVDGPVKYVKTCLYACTPDDDFLLDVLPNHPHVSCALGGGHGYKFASIMGKVLAELVILEKTSYPEPVSHFSYSRDALKLPSPIHSSL